jgi:HAE1 family hydrophobic/amphiphilic exporter-1
VIEFFLRRPIFAAVCSLVILLLGLISIPTLPVAQFPNISPPTVTVTASYTGASAEAVESSVTTPLEQAINGVQGLRYMSSQSSDNGSMTITCVFNLDRNLDLAANDVQNAVNLAQGRLPNEVKLTGVTVAKNAGTFVMALGVTSTDPKQDQIFITNYLENTVVNDLQRINGVSGVLVFGERKYAMRLWVNPKKLADNNLSAADVVNALTEQNIQVAAGSIGAPPTVGNQPYQYTVHANGRLSKPSEFADIIIKTSADGGYVRVRDIGRVELGAADYSSSLWFNGRPGVGMGVMQLPSGNALSVSKAILETMTTLSARFPRGMHYQVAFDSTEFVRESIKEVVFTLFGAIALVVLVIFLFLQDWRTTLIPALTIPVSLIGTFFLMQVLGFSINTLTLFGLTLATGLVVDDAIVVIENIARFIKEKKMTPFEGAREAMREISGAVVASSLVLLAVFIPVAFFPGTTGELYRQFALTIACSIAISLFNALTLTQILSALLLGTEPHTFAIFRPITRAIEGTRAAYHRVLPHVASLRALVLVVFIAALGATAYLYATAQTGFVPDEDQGFMILIGQAPEGVSLDYTNRVQRQIEAVLRRQPEISDVFDVGGFGFSSSGANQITMFVRLKPWGERPGAEHGVDAVAARVNQQLFGIPQAQIFALNPPSIPGLGFVGGFTFELEDRTDHGIPVMLGTAFQNIIGPAYAPNSGLARVYTLFRDDNPSLDVDVDRAKAKSLGVNLSDLFSTMQVYLGSEYVNDFSLGAQTYRVYVQADAPYRARIADLQRIYVTGGVAPNTVQIPLSGLVHTQEVKDAPTITHFNLYRSVEISGGPAPGHGSGDALNAMQALAAHLPAGFSYEWSGISREQQESGAQAFLIFALGIVFVYLVLAALYESFTDPLVIVLAVPVALLGALFGLLARHLISDVYAQVGYVMLIGLAAKNAILIVEFANQLRAQGKSPVAAVVQAAETRFRPIVMTSIAFVLGVLPLVFASGAGSAARISLGTVVACGMLFSTILNLFITPVLYIAIVTLRERMNPPKDHGPDDREGHLPRPTEAPAGI